MSRKKDGNMSVMEHLSELRLRLIIAVAAWLAAAVFSFTQISLIRSFLTAPLEGVNLIYLSPPEALTAHLRLAVIAGAVLASPIILYQAMAFLFPAFSRREKTFAVSVTCGISLLFCAGIFFAYRVAFPFTLNFFLQFASADLEPRFTISEYISFIFSFHLAFGAVFQLPMATWALGRIGLLQAQFLRRNRKFALLIMLALSAMITPSDIISQIVMAGPLLFLYEVGILMVVLSERKRKKELIDAGIAT